MMLNMRRLRHVALRYGFADLEAELRASTYRMVAYGFNTFGLFFFFFVPLLFSVEDDFQVQVRFL